MDVRRTAAQWAFIQRIETIDKTDFTVKMRLPIDVECFVQVCQHPQRFDQLHPGPQSSANLCP